MYLTTSSFAGAYFSTRRALLEAPELSPRGISTREIVPYYLVLQNPRSRLGFHSQRGFHLPFAIAESLLLFSETQLLQHFTWANKRMADFSDDGHHLYGAYGNRISQFLLPVIQKLKDDRDTRQAVLPIAVIEDSVYKTKNQPCTLSLHFLIRENKLQLHTTMRSNDFFWGFPYDVFTFTTLQEIVANELEIDVGEYHHNVTSLHVYHYHYEKLEATSTMEDVSCAIPYDVTRICQLSNMYLALTQGADPRQYNIRGPFENILKAYASHKLRLHYDEPLPSWSLPFMEKFR